MNVRHVIKMSKDIVNIKVSDIFPGFPDIEQHGVSDQQRTLTVEETRIFHKNKHKIGKVIIEKTDNRETHYGARALNVRFPSFLDRHTRDFDIFSPKPYQDARETEKALDKLFGGDFFGVREAEHPRTWKLFAHATNETYADYTMRPKGLRREKIRGIYYPTIPYIERSLKRTLADPTASYRHAKDQDALNRIEIYKRRLF